jgi:hypothetical protein
MHYPPWRKPEYMRANWLSSDDKAPTGAAQLPDTVGATAVSAASFSGEFELSVPRAQRRRPRLVHPQHRRTSTTAWDSSFHGRHLKYRAHEGNQQGFEREPTHKN